MLQIFAFYFWVTALLTAYQTPDGLLGDIISSSSKFYDFCLRLMATLDGLFGIWRNIRQYRHFFTSNLMYYLRLTAFSMAYQNCDNLSEMSSHFCSNFLTLSTADDESDNLSQIWWLIRQVVNYTFMATCSKFASFTLTVFCFLASWLSCIIKEKVIKNDKSCLILYNYFKLKASNVLALSHTSIPLT